MAANKRKIVKYRRRAHLNIGIVIFAFVLIYFIVYLLSFLTDKTISVYEVQQGQIAHSKVYNGLIIRTEEVTNATVSGDINYYAKEGDKEAVDDLICSIDQDGNLAAKITKAGKDASKLSSTELEDIQNDIIDFVYTDSDVTFYNIYGFKESVNAKIQENLYLNALNELSDEADSAISNNTFTLVNADNDGVLAFYTDGYEDVTPDTFSPDLYSPGSYNKTNLKDRTSVENGDALYKSVMEENWYVYIPLSKSDYSGYRQNLESEDETFTEKVLFKKDNKSAYAVCTLINQDSQYFLQLKFNSSMVRYISDRYLEVEMGSTNNSGLKIPNSSIVEKEFLVIPKDYVSKGGNSSKNGVLKVNSGLIGGGSTEFVETDLYYETEDSYYISEDNLKVGDVLQKSGSDETYKIEKTSSLKGVYNVNKGYAVFKVINLISSNEEYSVVETGTSYGLSLYDRIALNGSSIKEGDLVN